MSTTDTSSSHVKTLEAIVNAEEKIIGKLLDALPDKTEAALHTAWDKFLSIVDARLSSNGVSQLADEAKTVIEDVVSGKFDEARSALRGLVHTEADHVSAHLGNLIQSMAEFTGGNHGVLSSLIHSVETNGLHNGLGQLAASTGGVSSSSAT
ncbi:MAG: hypothetical protein J0I31_02730 [Rhizobiales bacterium]|nr:hypothetical protein [Hyphomicrobiales bacterium]